MGDIIAGVIVFVAVMVLHGTHHPEALYLVACGASGWMMGDGMIDRRDRRRGR